MSVLYSDIELVAAVMSWVFTRLVEVLNCHGAGCHGVTLGGSVGLDSRQVSCVLAEHHRHLVFPVFGSSSSSAGGAGRLALGGCWFDPLVPPSWASRRPWARHWNPDCARWAGLIPSQGWHRRRGVDVFVNEREGLIAKHSEWPERHVINSVRHPFTQTTNKGWEELFPVAVPLWP